MRELAHPHLWQRAHGILLTRGFTCGDGKGGWTQRWGDTKTPTTTNPFTAIFEGAEFWLLRGACRGGSSRCVLSIKVKVGCKRQWGDIGDIRTNKRILSFCSNQFRFRVKCQLDLCYIMNTYGWSWFYNLHNKIQTWWFISILRPPRHNHHCLFINF